MQYGVTKMVLGLIGGEAPAEVVREIAAGAACAKVDPALVERLFDQMLSGRMTGSA